MASSLRYFMEILRSPLRMHHFHRALVLQLRPVLIPLAKLHRKIFLKRTRLAVVTGTFGKTSTTRMLKAALFAEHRPRTNWNPESAVALELLHTSPRRRQMVLEIGIDKPGSMTAFAWMLKPDLAVVTSIGSEHHTAFGSLEAIRNEKAKIIKALPPEGVAVLNGDSPDVLWMKDQTAAKVVTFGLGAKNDVRAESVHLDWPRGTELVIHAWGLSHQFSIRLLGWPMVYGVLGAVAASLEYGLSLEAVAERLKSLEPTTGRLEPVALSNGAWIIRDEFKASLETVEAALDVLEEIPAGRRIVVLGKIFEPKGDKEMVYRNLGLRAAKCADFVVLVGESELWAPFLEGATGTGIERNGILRVRKAYPEALRALPSDLGPRDVVLIKGQSEQRLDRVALALMGGKVRCSIRECTAAVTLRCDRCKMLARNWSPPGLSPG